MHSSSCTPQWQVDYQLSSTNDSDQNTVNTG